MKAFDFKQHAIQTLLDKQDKQDNPITIQVVVALLDRIEKVTELARQSTDYQDFIRRCQLEIM